MATVPTPQSGSGIFGLVPGALDPISAILAQATSIGSPSLVGMPNPFGDLSAIYPGLGKTNNALSALIAGQLAGELSPQEKNAIQDARARFGVSSGMVGSGLNNNATVRDLGLATGQRQQQGVANYGSIIPTISRTQTVDPSLQAQIGQFNANAANNIAHMNAQFQNQFALANAGAQNRAQEFNSNIADRNATYAAAPNPEAAQTYAQKLFNDYLQKTQNSGGQIGGGSSVNRSFGGPAAGTSGIFGQGGTFDSDGRFTSSGGGGYSGPSFGTATQPISSPIVPSFRTNRSSDFNRQNNNPTAGYGPNYTTDFSGNPFEGLDFSSYGTRTDTLKPWVNPGAGPTLDSYTFPTSDNWASPYFDWLNTDND